MSNPIISLSTVQSTDKSSAAYDLLFDKDQLICFQRKINARPCMRIYPFDPSEQMHKYQYVVLNTFMPNSASRTEASVQLIQGITVELDFGSLEEQIKQVPAILGTPTVQVWSGNKSVHNHYRFDRPISIDEHRKLNDLILSVFPFADESVLRETHKLVRNPNGLRDKRTAMVSEQIDPNQPVVQSILSVGTRVSYDNMITRLEQLEKTKRPSIMKVFQHVKYTDMAHFDLYSSEDEIKNGLSRSITTRKEEGDKVQQIKLRPLPEYIFKMMEDGHLTSRSSEQDALYSILVSTNPLIKKALPLILNGHVDGCSNEEFAPQATVHGRSNRQYSNNSEIQQAVLETLAETPGVFDHFQDFKRAMLAFKSIDLPYDGMVDKIFQGSSGYNEQENRKMYNLARPNKVNFGTVYWYAEYANKDLLKTRLSEIAKQRIEAERLSSIVEQANCSNTSDGTTHAATKVTADKKKEMTADGYKKMLRDELGYTFSVNDMTERMYVDGEEMTDSILATIKLRARDWGILRRRKISYDVLEDVITVLAEENRFHPIKQYYESLPPWDGTDYIGQLAKVFPNDLNAKRFLEIWFAGTVRKTYESGKQMPSLVLSSIAQGIGKSTFSKWCCPKSMQKKYYAELIIDPHSKDCEVRGMELMIAEMAELGSVTKKVDVDGLKFFLSKEEVRTRRPYAHHDVNKPFVCSFIGTVNSDGGFLQDISNRRFLIINAEGLNYGLFISMDVNLVWAQAIVLYKQGKAVVSPEERLAQEMVNDRYVMDTPIHICLEKHIVLTGSRSDFVFTSELMDLIKTDGIQINNGTNNGISNYMARIGAIKSRVKGARGYFGIKVCNRQMLTQEQLLNEEVTLSENKMYLFGIKKHTEQTAPIESSSYTSKEGKDWLKEEQSNEKSEMDQNEQS